MEIFIWVISIIVYITALRYLYRIGRSFLDWRSGKRKSSKSQPIYNSSQASVDNDVTTNDKFTANIGEDSEVIIATGPVKIVGIVDDNTEDLDGSEEKDEIEETKNEEPEENQETDSDESEDEIEETKKEELEESDLDLTLDFETTSSSGPEKPKEEERYTMRRKKAASTPNRSKRTTGGLELVSTASGNSRDRSSNFSGQGDETKESFVFNLPGTDQELVIVHKPSDQQIDVFGKLVTSYTDKLVGSMDAMMTPMLDMMETAHPEMKDTLKDVRDLFGNEEDDEEDTDDELNDLNDQERINKILERADEGKEKEKNSEARGSQNKLSEDAKIDRLMEKMHGLRKTIIENTAAKQSDPKKKANILALGGMMDNLAETFSSGGITEIIGQLMGPFPTIEQEEVGRRHPITLLTETLIGTTCIEEEKVEEQEEVEEQEKVEEREKVEKQEEVEKLKGTDPLWKEL